MTQNKFKKIFVGGLPPQTTENDMREYFSKYGDVCDVVAMRDKTGNKSRGFGFVVFKDAESVDRCQSERPHYLLGKVVDTKRAMPKEESINPDIHCNSKRIFIGGIRKFFTEDDLRSYFGNFGQIVDCTIKRDNVSGVSRGFAFITFTDRDIVDKVILSKPHSIRHCIVDVKKALSPEELRQIDESQCQHSDYDNDYQRIIKPNIDQEEDKLKENGGPKVKKLTKRSQSYPIQNDFTSPNYPGYVMLSPDALSGLNSAPPTFQYDQMPLIWMSIQQCQNGLLLTPVAPDLYSSSLNSFFFNQQLAASQNAGGAGFLAPAPTGNIASPGSSHVLMNGFSQLHASPTATHKQHTPTQQPQQDASVTTTTTNQPVSVNDSSKLNDLSDIKESLPLEEEISTKITSTVNGHQNNNDSANYLDDESTSEEVGLSPISDKA